MMASAPESILSPSQSAGTLSAAQTFRNSRRSSFEAGTFTSV